MGEGLSGSPHPLSAICMFVMYSLRNFPRIERARVDFQKSSHLNFNDSGEYEEHAVAMLSVRLILKLQTFEVPIVAKSVTETERPMES